MPKIKNKKCKNVVEFTPFVMYISTLHYSFAFFVILAEIPSSVTQRRQQLYIQVTILTDAKTSVVRLAFLDNGNPKQKLGF